MYVYLDLIFILNLAVDFLLLHGTNRLTGIPAEFGKCALGALLGGLYGAACLLPGLHFLANGFWRTVFLASMGAIAFGWNRSALQRIAVYVILSMALGGLASGIRGGGLFGLLILGGLLLVLCRVGFRGNIGGESLLRADLFWEGRRVHLYALRDTGNTLRDPLTGEQVLVCGADVGEELLGIDRNRFSDPVSLLTTVPGARLIPYHSVGMQSGMMMAVRLDKAIIGGKAVEPLIAFAPREIAKGEVYRMLTGGTI